MLKGKDYFGGYFDIEEHAAMKVNLLCDKIEIQRKNPMIIIEPDTMRKVIHSFLITHQKIKTRSGKYRQLI